MASWKQCQFNERLLDLFRACRGMGAELKA
jgi:hypothetical protein